jgi:hypothetical protein
MPPRKGIIKVRNPARMSKILRKMDQLTVLWAKVESGATASLIVESSRIEISGPNTRTKGEGGIVRLIEFMVQKKPFYS